ncbi:mRNA cap guanine-N7 methyltransferase, putative [Plasmodium yoelii]|uniref:mRNA (guanine-N(7))-methyltransferase n=1 Tax=Plasmodium yoelii TaxID=5861 RepID=A0A4V0KJF1_PLAYE|nr:mRNA cap guanine-N7 methyltransferase, putative [Plasmodium yoelii]VTZ77112.1 mRNA cap guanine-N7 methyltransferase, putative [Plasmodium yoelii]|eukprot:XP_034493462.1 mRNA cap guanine-N7 methyltransferase, putative [Plasmodium yoelii]
MKSDNIKELEKLENLNGNEHNNNYINEEDGDTGNVNYNSFGKIKNDQNDNETVIEGIQKSNNENFNSINNDYEKNVIKKNENITHSDNNEKGYVNNEGNKKVDEKLCINKNNLFHEINLLIKKKLKINDIIKLNLFYKDNCTKIKPYTIFDNYKNVNMESKINIEIINFLKNCFKNNIRFIDIYSSVVELRGNFNDELINLPIINQIILQKINNNSYKCNFNIDNSVLNYIYVDLLKINKSKSKFKILKKIYEIEEWYYYPDEKNENNKKSAKKNQSEEKSENDDTTSSDYYESDSLIHLYNEEKKKNEKNEQELLNINDTNDSIKKKIDKDKLYIQKLKKLVEEDSDEESIASSENESSSNLDDLLCSNKNHILYKRKILYTKDDNDDNKTVIKIYKEINNEMICVYYPNSSYNQCISLSTLKQIQCNSINDNEVSDKNIYDIYVRDSKKNLTQNIKNDILDCLNEENVKVKKRYIKDVSVYNFCSDDKYKGCNLYLHISKNKKCKNVKIDYNIDYAHFDNNCDIIKMYEVKEGIDISNGENGENEKNGKTPVGTLFDIDKDWKVNIDMHMDIEKAVNEFKKKINGKTDEGMFDENNYNEGEHLETNKLDYLIYNFYKNFECLINLINKLKNSSVKYDYFYPKMIGDVNEEIRKHYDKKKVILLKKSNIKYIRIFNNEVKRIMILFFVSYNSKILDLACGHGQDMLKYNSVKNKIYIGLDISKKEIELAKERLNQNGIKGLCDNDSFIFLQGDILNNKFYRKWKNKNITFDIISINLALHYIIYNEKMSKKFFKILDNFLENEGLLLATTISTITLTDFLMNRSILAISNDTISIKLENDLFTIKFDQENLLKIFKNKNCLDDFIEYINNADSDNKIKYEYFYNIIKNALENTIGIKYYFYLYDTIDASEFVIPQNYLKKKLQEINMVELFNNTAIMFLHYITNNLETYEKYKNIKFFNLINKTIDHNIFESIKLRINKIHGYDKDSQIYYDICSLYHVYVYKKNFDASILGIV